jgi:hypothetical protein
MSLIIVFAILNIIDLFQTRVILIQDIEFNPFVRFIGFNLFIIYKILMVIFIAYIFYPVVDSKLIWMIFLTAFYLWVTIHNYRVLKYLS